MNPFDLEKAKAGAKVEWFLPHNDPCVNHGKWIDVHFVGISMDGHPMIEYEYVSPFKVKALGNLRLKPKPSRKMYAYPYLAGRDWCMTTPSIDKDYVNANHAKSIASGVLVGEVQSILVPDES